MKPSPFLAKLTELLEEQGWEYHPRNQGFHHKEAGLVANVQGMGAIRIETVHDQGAVVRHARTSRRTPESAAEDLAAQVSLVMSELYPNVEPAP